MPCRRLERSWSESSGTVRGTLIVDTREGALEDTAENGIGVWPRIPYARPPVGALRGRSSDLPFTFNPPRAATSSIDWNRTAQSRARCMHASFIEFARSGDPNILALPPWPKHTLEGLVFMIFDARCRVSTDFVGAIRRRLGLPFQTRLFERADE
jgi:carboxylesterase type B